MITRRTKVQLLIFVLITLVGVSYVGARYAQLDRFFYDDAFSVVAHFEKSGGIYEGAEVNYRGVKIGEVGELELSDNGVDVNLEIDKEWDSIPADSVAIVGNRSAVGEQYVELQPETKSGPYLRDDDELDKTDIPIPTEKLLTDASTTVGSVDREALTTTIDELGSAFAGTGDDLQAIIDSGTSFVEAADQNFTLTQNLLRDGNTVLKGQIASESAIRNFARDLSLFSGTLRDANPDLIRLIESGAAGANELRTFIEANKVNLSELLSRVATTGEVVRQNLPGIKHILVIYPHVVEGTFGVVDRDPSSGLNNAHFGLALAGKQLCKQGYEVTEHRNPFEGSNKKLPRDARCTAPPEQTNARGAQNAPRAAADYTDVTMVGEFDRETQTFEWGAGTSVEPVETNMWSFRDDAPGKAAPATLGSDSWKWLYLQPLAAGK